MTRMDFEEKIKKIRPFITASKVAREINKEKLIVGEMTVNRYFIGKGGDNGSTRDVIYKASLEVFKRHKESVLRVAI